MKILDCDIGNTRCKWRLQDIDRITERGSVALADGFETLALNSDVDRVKWPA